MMLTLILVKLTRIYRELRYPVLLGLATMIVGIARCCWRWRVVLPEILLQWLQWNWGAVARVGTVLAFFPISPIVLLDAQTPFLVGAPPFVALLKAWRRERMHYSTWAHCHVHVMMVGGAWPALVTAHCYTDYSGQTQNLQTYYFLKMSSLTLSRSFLTRLILTPLVVMWVIIWCCYWLILLSHMAICHILVTTGTALNDSCLILKIHFIINLLFMF